jgi:hypothetical protein
MENAGVQKNQAAASPSVVRALWDPFGFMQMFGFGRIGEGPLFQVEEKDDTYVCKVKVNLTLPDQADVAHAKAELHDGELTLVVPKGVGAMPEAVSPPQTTATGTEPESSPRRARRAKGSGNGKSASAGRAPRRGARSPARRGR